MSDEYEQQSFLAIKEEQTESRYSEDELKFLKRFCGSMLEDADQLWEDHEKAKLLMLMQEKLRLSEKKFWKWLCKYTEPTAELIACLGDTGLQMQTKSIIQTFGGGSIDRIISSIEDCFESGLLDIEADDVLVEIYESVINRLDNHDVTRLIRAMSGFTKTKRRCGFLINIFCGHLTPDEVVSFVTNLMHYEVICELDGTIDSLMQEIQCIDHTGRQQIMANFNIDGRGNIVESDEDTQGNLKDFVCDDNEISICSSALLDSEDEFSDWIEEDGERSGSDQSEKNLYGSRVAEAAAMKQKKRDIKDAKRKKNIDERKVKEGRRKTRAKKRMLEDDNSDIYEAVSVSTENLEEVAVQPLKASKRPRRIVGSSSDEDLCA